MNNRKNSIFLILFAFYTPSFLHSSETTTSESDEDSESIASSIEESPEISKERVSNFIENVLMARNTGDILAHHATGISSSRHGIKHYASKQLKFEENDRDPFSIENKLNLSNENTGLGLFADSDEPASEEKINFYNKALEHPAICENEIETLVQQSHCKPENTQNLMRILLAQKQGIIFCRMSVHDQNLHTFYRKTYNSRRIHRICETDNFSEIKTFVTQAIRNILTAQVPGKITSSNGTTSHPDEHYNLWVKSIEINYQDNAGLKHPLEIRTDQKAASQRDFNCNRLHRTDQSLTHPAYLSKEELQTLIDATNIVPNASKFLLKILSTQRTGTIECAEDIHGVKFTTAYIRNANE